MKSVSLRLPDEIADEVEKKAKNLELSRTSYILLAIEAYNRLLDKEARNQRMAAASRKVRANSLRVNRKFSRIENDPED